MAQWVLKANDNVVPRRTARPLGVDEKHNSLEAKKRETFDALIEKRWGKVITPPQISKDETESWEEYHDKEELPRHIPESEDGVDKTGKLLCQKPAYDRIINAEVLLQNGDEVQKSKVIQRSIGPDGTTVGKYDDNPQMNSIIYDVEFPDGTIKEYSTNVIAENMLSQVDSDGFTVTVMEGIIDHKVDANNAVQKVEKYISTHSGQKKLRKTTTGWKLLVK